MKAAGRTVSLLILIALTAILLPVPAVAEPSRMPQIGVLWLPAGPDARIEAFKQGLRGLGWIEGQNVAIEYRYGDGQPERLSALATELVRLRVDVIFTLGDASIRAAKRASGSVPIVAFSSGFVEVGHAASLARPGGQVTGVTGSSPELSAKRLELLKEALPKLTRVAVLWNPDNLVKAIDFRETQTGARALGVRLQSLEVRGPNEFEARFAAATRARAEALVVLQDALTIAHATRIVALAAKSRLPAMYALQDFVDAGGLIYYGVKQGEMERRAASLVDKILKGGKPGDLPIEQPTRFELVINLKAAKALGLTIPQSVLVRADHVVN